MVDVLLIQPLTSVWSEYSPLHASNEFAIEDSYDKPFARISKALMEEKMDFHYGNENIMANHGSVDGGALRVGKHSYSCVIMPPSRNLKSSTYALLKEYLKAGGKLIAVGEIPSRIDGAEADVDLTGAIPVDTVAEAISAADAFFPERVRITDQFTGKNASTVFVHSREEDGSIRHLIVNTDEARKVKASVRIPGNATTAVVDLYNGCAYKFDPIGGEFDVILAPAGSLLVVCGEEAKGITEPLPAILESGACFEDFATAIPDLAVEDFDCEPLEENVFLLNDFSLELDGRVAYEGPVCGAWHKHFYPAAEGTPFKATYTFASEIEAEGCFAAIEVAENLDRITFNGAEVRSAKAPGELGAFDPAKSWKDINFTKVHLPKFRKGLNILVIEGRKSNNITGPGCHVRIPDWQQHRPTEAEEVYICGKFQVKQVSDGLYAIAGYEKPRGANLTEEGFPVLLRQSDV